MNAVKPSELRTLLACTIPAKEPILIAGAPGVGKTDIVGQACDEAGAVCQVGHPVVSDPTDYKGMPSIVEGRATFLPFDDLDLLIQADRPTVYFMDDLGQAVPAVQAAAMQLILARRIGRHAVSPHVVFLAATNRRGDRAGVSGILEPVKSRFLSVIELVADVDDWCTWAAGANVAPEVNAFIRLRGASTQDAPGLLSDFRPTADMTNSPSPRTWHAVSRTLQLNLPTSLRDKNIHGAVGEAAATEFIAFLKIVEDMVSPDLVLTSPDTAPIPTEPSSMYALVTALAARVQAATMTRFCRYLDRLCSVDKAEFAAVSLQTAIARDRKLSTTPGYINAMSGPLGRLMIGGEA